jgi:ABC-type uncharacterized transport system permease subunit
MLAMPEIIINTAPSPAFYVALVVYGICSLLYVSAFVDAPRWMGTAALWCMVVAFLAHGTDIGWRGVEGVHPGTSVREALGFLSWVMAGGYLLYRVKVKVSAVGAFVAPAALVMLAAARLSPSGEPVPGLNVLGRIHISLATIGVALFALATAVAIVYLLQERSLKRKHFDGALFKRGIALETLDRLSHRLVLVGFPIFTVSVMLGVVWVSQLAIGFSRPEWPLAIVTWAAFGGLIVARSVKGWRGRRAAVLTILGFGSSAIVFSIYFARHVMG